MSAIKDHSAVYTPGRHRSLLDWVGCAARAYAGSEFDETHASLLKRIAALDDEAGRRLCLEVFETAELLRNQVERDKEAFATLHRNLVKIDEEIDKEMDRLRSDIAELQNPPD